MKKITLKNLIDKENIYFYDFKHTKLDGFNGYLIKLCKNLSNEEKNNLLNKYNNIEFYISQKEYAPELKNTCVFIKNSKVGKLCK